MPELIDVDPNASLEGLQVIKQSFGYGGTLVIGVDRALEKNLAVCGSYLEVLVPVLGSVLVSAVAIGIHDLGLHRSRHRGPRRDGPAFASLLDHFLEIGSRPQVEVWAKIKAFSGNRSFVHCFVTLETA